MQEADCLKVPKKFGEQAIRLATKLNVFDYNLKIQQTKNYLLIPLTTEPSPIFIEKFKKKLSDFEISVHAFVVREKRHLVPLDFLTKKMPPSLLSKVPRAIDFVGDIAIVEIPAELATYKTTIGEAILKAHKQTATVLAKSGVVKGLYRLRNLEHIAGVKKTTTIYREYGCMYHVDVAKAYFSPRLSNEHNRVASQVTNGETVIDLFAGVGPFTILIAKKQKNVRIYAVDVNPNAISLLKQNITVNCAEKQVIPILGDARQIVSEQLLDKSDRVIMNLPENALDFVDVACQAIRQKGGIIHYYCFVNDPDPVETAKAQLNKAVNQNQRQVKTFLMSRTVREVAPYTWQVVVDAEIQ